MFGIEIRILPYGNEFRGSDGIGPRGFFHGHRIADRWQLAIRTGPASIGVGPYNGNLDRIQIVKGWLDKDGQTQERVYDVVWSDHDRRKPGADGKLPLVGNTVNVKKATWTNSIGAPELITVWKDPDFDAGHRAFYYARVIEIPTPRWTAYDAFRFGVTMGTEVPMTTQERAYTSPIWYTPGN